MTQWVKALATKPGDLSLILGTLAAREYDQFLQVVL